MAMITEGSNKNRTRSIKQQAILESATELLLNKPTATLQEIADYSGIGIATLHRYFSTKENLLDELALNAIHLVKEAFTRIEYDDEDFEKTLMSIISTLIPLGNKISFLGTAVSVDENPLVAEGEKQLKAPIISAFDMWKEKGKLNKNISSHWMVNVIYNLLYFTWQEIQNGNVAKNDAANLLLTTVLNGFTSQQNQHV